MTEEEYQSKIRKLLDIESVFSVAYTKLTEAFALVNTESPKKVIRNNLAYAVIAIYSIGQELGINVQDGIDLIQKDFEEKRKEQKHD